MKTRRGVGPSAAERGSAAVLFAIALPVRIGFKNELQQVADAALAAARELNGTKKGVPAARTAARKVVTTGSHCSPSLFSWSFSGPSNWRALCTCGAP